VNIGATDDLFFPLLVNDSNQPLSSVSSQALPSSPAAVPPLQQTTTTATAQHKKRKREQPSSSTPSSLPADMFHGNKLNNYIEYVANQLRDVPKQMINPEHFRPSFKVTLAESAALWLACIECIQNRSKEVFTKDVFVVSLTAARIALPLAGAALSNIPAAKLMEGGWQYHVESVLVVKHKLKQHGIESMLIGDELFIIPNFEAFKALFE